MELKVYKPVSPTLKKYIDCFYHLTRSVDEITCTYLSFPGLHSIVCLYTNAVTDAHDHLVGIRHEANGKLESKMVGEFNKPACIQYAGSIDEITILFHPVALNAFLPNPLSSYSSGHFSDFEPFDDYRLQMQAIMKTNNVTDRITALETYWESKIIGFKHPFLHKVVDELTSPEMNRDLSTLADSHNISRQKLHEQFKLHLLKSPAEFRKIVRFRQALKTKTDKQLQQENLTQLSAMVNYFDQSHMVRDFKAVTGYTPKQFFNGISTFGNGSINWFFQSQNPVLSHYV